MKFGHTFGFANFTPLPHTTMTYQQLLLSALAMEKGTDLITFFEAMGPYSAAPVVNCMCDGLSDAVYNSDVDDEQVQDTYELFDADHPEISVVLPVRGNADKMFHPIVTCVHALRVAREVVKN
jgi:hypothetical protein